MGFVNIYIVFIFLNIDWNEPGHRKGSLTYELAHKAHCIQKMPQSYFHEQGFSHHQQITEGILRSLIHRSYVKQMQVAIILFASKFELFFHCFITF